MSDVAPGDVFVFWLRAREPGTGVRIRVGELVCWQVAVAAHFAERDLEALGALGVSGRAFFGVGVGRGRRARLLHD